MRFKKGLLKSLVAGAISAVIAVGSAFCASAVPGFAVSGYGTYEEGIKAPIPFYVFYHQSIPGNGCPNLDFEQGFMYWMFSYNNNDTMRKITDFAELKKDSKNNTYVRINETRAYAGLRTAKFTIDELSVGATPGILYKWRGDQHYIQVYLEEYYSADNKEEGGKTKRIGHNGDRGATQIWPADEDDPEDWNIALSVPNGEVLASTTENTKRYYSIGVEVTKEDVWMEFDDIQVVIVNETSNKVFDLQGKEIYDLTNLPKRQYIDYDWGDLSETVDTSEDVSQSSAQLSGSDKVTQAQKETGNSLYWIIIAVAVVIVAAAAVVTVVLVKKKKSKPASEEAIEASEAAESTDDSAENG